MRISDWSSDVCSSDLADLGRRWPPPPCPSRPRWGVDRAEAAEHPDAQMRVRDVRLYGEDRAHMACAGRSAALPDPGSRPPGACSAGPRKSVVEGKRGPRRVEPGGRQLSTNKKQK